MSIDQGATQAARNTLRQSLLNDQETTAIGNLFLREPLKGLFGELSEERHLRGLNQERFASRLAQILGTLNAVHAFREGNGRAQREFVRELAYKNSYWIDWSKVSREELYQASDASFMRGDNTLFEKLLRRAIEPIDRDKFPPPGARRT